ncbi:GNAT superfamily N-acetyltransferase [Microbacterium sp. W4I4]|uniref:GNAT family N-acetyltransferase n=1 Tax=Microbacterium sp. W4I4 TaxID=3042295 RepID=UPI0027826409|nr:GNAT family N-acetyltransferase [Microbacterium sp. W4I4]MDQ0612993.1 GNAT superfamily N-acetyltransferase [Microbacterium sp. W4I4]
MMSIRLTDTAVLRPLVLPARADAAPTEDIRVYADVRNRAIRDVTGRDDDDMTPESLLPILRSNSTASRRQWIVEQDGQAVGCVTYAIPQDGEAATAFVTIALRKHAWGAGIGSAAHAYVETELRSEGMRTLLHWAEHHHDGSGLEPIPSPMGFGSVPADHAARFLQRHGYHVEQVDRGSEYVYSAAGIRDLEALRARAAAPAAGYRIVQWMMPTPADRVEGYAWLKSRMSTDVPEGDLGLPVEVWDAARVAEHDDRYAQRGWTVQVTAAEHVDTGELCAFNELTIGPDPTGPAHQQDTLVLADHRGHRLGMLVKTAGLLSWHERFPASARVITYNAEQNRPMLDINEAIGFTPFAYEGAWKKVLT